MFFVAFKPLHNLQAILIAPWSCFGIENLAKSLKLVPNKLFDDFLWKKTRFFQGNPKIVARNPVRSPNRITMTVTVATVAGNVHVGLMAVLVLILSWLGWRLPMRFITGMRSTGLLERTGKYAAIDPAVPMDRNEVLRTGQVAKRHLEFEPEAEEQ